MNICSNCLILIKLQFAINLQLIKQFEKKIIHDLNFKFKTKTAMLIQRMVKNKPQSSKKFQISISKLIKIVFVNKISYIKQQNNETRSTQSHSTSI